MPYPFITQSAIDGRWQANVDDVLIASRSYDSVERAVSELIAWRAQKQCVEDSLDAMEEQRTYDRELTLEVWGVWGLVVALALVLGAVAYFVG